MRFEIDARLVEVRERRLVSRFGGGRLADIGLPLLLSDRDVAELQPPRHFGVRVFGGRSRLLDRRLRLPDGDGIVPRVDQHQEIALVDELVVGDRQLHDLARHLRGDLHDIGADRAVARPWRAHVILPRLPAGESRDGDRHHRCKNGQDAEGRQDRPALDPGQGLDVVGLQLDAGHQRLQRAITRTIDETIIT